MELFLASEGSSCSSLNGAEDDTEKLDCVGQVHGDTAAEISAIPA